jgi:hypothetical protein
MPYLNGDVFAIQVSELVLILGYLRYLKRDRVRQGSNGVSGDEWVFCHVLSHLTVCNLRVQTSYFVLHLLTYTLTCAWLSRTSTFCRTDYVRGTQWPVSDCLCFEGFNPLYGIRFSWSQYGTSISQCMITKADWLMTETADWFMTKTEYPYY